jgi:hypothetical protein
MKGAFLFNCKELEIKVGNSIFKTYESILINDVNIQLRKYFVSPRCQQSKMAKAKCLMRVQRLIDPHIQQE